MNSEEFIKNIKIDIEKLLTLNDKTYQIPSEYKWFREVITLYAKQHNLLKSAIILMDNEMNEEAYILVRSAMNNYFLIGYLLNDDNERSRLNEYKNQPLISEKYFLNNVKEMIQGEFGQRMNEKGMTIPYTLENISSRIAEIEHEMNTCHIRPNERPLSIKKIAENSDSHGFDFYATEYYRASKFEHSDISSVYIYRNDIEAESDNLKFKIDLSKTNEKLKENLYGIFEITYLDSFCKIFSEIIEDPKLHNNYDINQLGATIVKVTNYLINMQKYK